jgi:16S rRNA (cytosine967-C5)-methyltransferase
MTFGTRRWNAHGVTAGWKHTEAECANSPPATRYERGPYVTPSARIAAAIELLETIDDAVSKPADAVANAFFRARRFIGAGDRRAISERVWTVLRTWRRLAWWLQGAATPRRLVAASMLMDRWTLPGVAQGFSGGRFAPAPLSDEEMASLRRLEGHTLDHPRMPSAVRLEVPDWILPLLQARFGAALPAEMAALLAPAPLDLRVNLLKTTREQAQAALAAEGIAAQPTPISPWGLRIAGRLPVTTGRAFREGLVEIQNEGSQIVVALAGAAPEMGVVDFCAGAGGKTLALAMTMLNRGHIVASDVSAPRLDGAVKRLSRAGVHNVERHLVAPGDKWMKRRRGSFDRVLVDAPCTGTGTWRRNSDARLRLTANDLAELVTKQAQILDQASRLVRTGGRLVYATCSMLIEENETQVQTFLARHSDFHVVPLAAAWTLAGPPPCERPFMVLTPDRHGTDGFFAAVLERHQ